MPVEKKHDEIESVSLDRINPDEVIIITNSSPGAMGFQGLFEIFSVHERHVLYFSGNWMDGLDSDEVNKHLPIGTRIVGSSLHLHHGAGWVIFGGGMGNVFLIRDKYYPELQDRCLLSPYQRSYRSCIGIAEDYLVDIANGFPSQEAMPADEIAEELVKFALKEYTGSADGKGLVSAVLWCDANSVEGYYSCHVKGGKIIPGICEDWKQTEVDGKYDKAHIRIDFGYKHAEIFRRLAPGRGSLTVYNIRIENEPSLKSGQHHISFEIDDEHPMFTRIIVTGSRNFDNYALLEDRLDCITYGIKGEIEIVSGNETEAGLLGKRYAREKGLPFHIIKPDWEKDGGRTGPFRNQRMLDYASEKYPMVVAFWDGSSSETKDMITRAEKADIYTEVVNINPAEEFPDLSLEEFDEFFGHDDLE